MLKDGSDVIRHFEDLAEKRRKGCQRMLEVGVVLELLALLLWGLGYEHIRWVFWSLGILTVDCGMILHLRFFDHTRAEIFRCIFSIILYTILSVIAIAVPIFRDNSVFRLLRLLPAAFLWGANVWTTDWKSTFLWLIIALYIGTPLLTLGRHFQNTGAFNKANPFHQNYRVAEVLYPANSTDYLYGTVELSPVNSLILSEDGIDTVYLGVFSYDEPTVGDTAKGIWVMETEKQPGHLYRLTVEADDSVILSCFVNQEMKWKWKLKKDDHNLNISVGRVGAIMTMHAIWYPPEAPDPEPSFSYTAVAPTADLNLVIGNLETETLTLIEEYHHANQVEYAQYQLEPRKPGVYTIKLETRYEGDGQYALYRIPFRNGEFRFTLAFG